jgi:hypothetical protein
MRDVCGHALEKNVCDGKYMENNCLGGATTQTYVEKLT